MSNSLVLAFFRDTKASQAALKSLRRERVGRVASITQSLDGKTLVDDRPLADAGATIMGSVGVALAASLLPLPRNARLLAAAGGAAVGFAIGRTFDTGVSDRTLRRYKPWVVKGETLVLLEGDSAKVDRALELLRADETVTPTTFVVRSAPASNRAQGSDEAPDALHREPLPPERLREHASAIASAHLRVLSREAATRRQPLLTRLRQNEAVITGVNTGLAEAARLEQAVSLSAEWLLDNAYIIEGQIADVRRNLSRKFYGELPVITEQIGVSLPDVPRAYALACELIAHTDARLDKTNITEFIEAYQEVAPLTMGELWALPLMLRLALVENLRRLTNQTDLRQRERERADFWANRLLNAAHHDPDRLLSLLSDLSKEQSQIKAHFADRLVSHLYDEEASLGPVQSWLERKLDAPLPEILAGEQRRQASDQVAVANTITSLRLLSHMDWRDHFENLSRTEHALREDAAYPRLDFATRDTYRHEVERIARGAKRDEVEVAREAIQNAHREAERAQEASGIPAAAGDVVQLASRPQEHVGYFLIGDGQPQLESEFRYAPPLSRKLQNALLERPLPFYLGSLALTTTITTVGVALLTRRLPLAARLLLGGKALLPASEVAAQSVNYLVTRTIPPRSLPKMNFETGIPDEFRTLVGVPMLLLNEAALREELDALEVRYLANPDSNLRFALLSDFPDAPEQNMPGDPSLLEAVRVGVDELNLRYGGDKMKPFLVFGRERVWCAGEGCWMGWERKRGKLEQLNRFLRDQSEVSPTEIPAEQLHVLAGEASAVQGIKFVITLDADTQLPHGTARRLVETLAHPLNRPHFGRDEKHQSIVTRGYSVIQPRVDTALPSATTTRFSRLFTDAKGSDPYTHVVSDVYQDLFGEGSYHGKGIYDLEAFDHALTGRFPDNTLLSHDLIEGAHARVGLASDIELLDDFPSTYAAYAKRQHRWVRGDWQIAAWATGRVPAPVQDGSKLVANPLSGLNRWKIFDNLRRSLLPPATLGLLAVGWMIGGTATPTASVLAGLVLLAPVMIAPLGWVPKPPLSFRVAGNDLLATLARGLADAAFLPHQAMLSLDAIVRVLYRKNVTHRGLLEWQTAKVAAQSQSQQKRSFLAQIATPAAVGAGVGALALLRGGVASAPFVLPYIVAWVSSPLLARWLEGGKIRPVVSSLSSNDKTYLRHIARETWRYFDDFVGPQTNWLPPDNYQETLRVEIAQRTSPTNIGLWLQAVLAARDFGWLTMDEVVGRALHTMESLDKLQTFRGHLLNWYGLGALEPLLPRYVSTVDSGNLLGSLWCVEAGVREQISAPVVDASALRGLSDVLGCLLDAAGREGFDPLPTEAIGALRQLFDAPVHSPIELIGRLRAAEIPANELIAGIAQSEPREKTERRPTQRQAADQQLATSDPRFATGATAYWAAKLLEQLDGWVGTVDRYARWLELLNTPPDEFLLPLGEPGRELRRTLLQAAPSLSALGSGTLSELNDLLAMRTQPALPEPLRGWLDQLEHESSVARWLSGEVLGEAEVLLSRIKALGDGMQFGFLFDEERKLFSIGYNVEDARLDTNDYDLLASECRLASFCTVARGEVPVEHWYSLGRRYGVSNGRALLLSWSGTMFEYLMPMLYLRSYPNSLLDDACRNAVLRQIDYGNSRGVPWGISEAAFSALDANRIYQYKAFGCPGLGLKRGLDADLVIAPYATAMALVVEPVAALQNLKRLESIGMRGDYGFYESIDFTRERLNEDEGTRMQDKPTKGAIVRAFMVHHQGMALMAMDNLLFEGAMQRRFHANPIVEAATPLLYERVPTATPALEEAVAPEARRPRDLRIDAAMASPTERIHQADTPLPRTLLLGGGDFSLMITNTGGGYTRWREMDVTRWKCDTTRDNWGSFFFLRDLESGATWGATHQPLRRATRLQTITFKADRAEFKRRDNDIETITEVVVSPEDPADIRRITLVNHSPRPRKIELTSYVEVTLAPHAADRQHPAFQKLFVQTEALEPGENGALGVLAWRRPRSDKDQPVWAGHLMTGEDAPDEISYETDRSRFIGRARSLENPVALEGDLSNTSGAVLDPIFAVRRRITLRPGERITLACVTVAGESRDNVVQLLEKYRDMGAVARASDLAWTHSQLEMHHLRIKGDEAQRFQQLAAHLLYPSAPLRAPARRLRENHKGQSGLWAYGISGDLPIIVVTVDNARDLPIVRSVLTAHTFWRVRGLKCDLVILNEQGSSYDDSLTDTLRKLIGSNTPYTGIDQPGGVFLRLVDQIPRDDLTLLLTCARVHVVAARGGLSQQLADATPTVEQGARLSIAHRPAEEPSAPLPFMELPYFNGWGGFSSDGREYSIYLGPKTVCPAPWSNVVANSNFGALLTESGQGYAWCGNSQSNKLTTWSNDPTTDAPGEAIYIRDEESGVFWSPTPLPVRENDAYRARHGQGYTVWEHNSHAIEQELLTFVPTGDAEASQSGAGDLPVRVQRLKLRNRSSRPRRLTVTFFCDWVLGTTKEETQMHVVTTWDAQSRTLFARNSYHPDFGGKTAWVSSSPPPRNFTADRSAFIGRNGSLASPAAMRSKALADHAGAGFDPCGAIQVEVSIEPGRETEVTFLLGQTDSIDEARGIVSRFRQPQNVQSSINGTSGFWDEVLSAITVECPDLAINFMLNRWLVYQVLACRVWGRSAFYQSGGAFGFRDQLQDVCALLYSQPKIAREQLLRAAAHQFEEGDVQHWWHPPSGAGVRTRFSDDLLWLPFVTAQYVRVTGDVSVLEEEVAFLSAPELGPDEHEKYFQPAISPQKAPLWEHCRRAIERGCTKGVHDLPLIGIGDWNDGMSHVGVEGKGESVWLAWFLVETLNGFAELCDNRDPAAKIFAGTCRERARQYAQAVEQNAWDGEWYRRAYYDNGAPLGSHLSDEAKIDSLPQSWAILSGAGNPQRIEQAMHAVEERLIREDLGIILLFNPPFDKTTQNPGYIKGYLPGVRENGGQYTHAAIWTAMAFARKGDGNRAVELLRMLNPVEHARTEEEVQTYKVEPYVVAADIYNLEGQYGRGGWTWYTGSASWMYRVWIEEIFGFTKRGDTLTFDPRVPPRWRQFTLRYRFEDTRYDITVQNPEGVERGVVSVEMDDNLLPDGIIPLKDDGQFHHVRVRMGTPKRVVQTEATPISGNGQASEAVPNESDGNGVAAPPAPLTVPVQGAKKTNSRSRNGGSPTHKTPNDNKDKKP